MVDIVKDKVVVKDLRQGSAHPMSATSLMQDVGVTEENQLHIDNKYYRATLQCVLQEGDEAQTHALPADHEYDAAVLVIDTLEAQVPHHVSRHLTALTESSVSILIVADTCQIDSRPQEEVRRICLEHNAEYTIVKSASNSSGSGDDEAANEEDGATFKDAVGAGRIREALEAHMWAHLEMKAQPARKSQQQQQQQVPAGDEQGPTEATATQEGEQQQEQEAAEGGGEDALLTSLLQSLTTIGNENFADDDDLDGDNDAFNLLQLVTQMREIRESATSVSDEQRRERAAQVAMALADMLAGDDDGQDGDGDVAPSDQD
ncbi:hypothetical protein PTSG_07677 [Salpingoeca rosetta]|uniref:Uncharacterized protein n=1 Tax=Salpingoeca rosetta (strain ATCC 50818 / BSB-021) TaxID=946362 RepID=F2UHG3_SALR5|nr:uncharacterized protein PTSG_07677 [Salpingoeca rosetta]EGD76562.1 hypothetical protein PTSG_07677 [Salpingoeca rosetta]|eukprot:XP_004991476.1 hypothetical protein PTSG_07677 [Salpingoeca rosetta]